MQAFSCSFFPLLLLIFFFFFYYPPSLSVGGALAIYLRQIIVQLCVTVCGWEKEGWRGEGSKKLGGVTLMMLRARALSRSPPPPPPSFINNPPLPPNFPVRSPPPSSSSPASARLHRPCACWNAREAQFWCKHRPRLHPITR